MTFGCPICSESLEKSPNEEIENNVGGILISAAPCGHVFHRFCITTWLKGTLATSSKCPCCRKNIPKLICIPLFPTIHDETILEDDDARIPCDHKPQIRELTTKVADLEHTIRNWEQIQKSTTEDLELARSRLLAEERKAQTYMEKCQAMKSLLSHEDDLKKKLAKAKKELECLQSLKDALDSVKADNDLHEDRHWAVNQDSIDNLVGMKMVLTRELRSHMTMIKSCGVDKERYRAENVRLRGEIKTLKKRNDDIIEENENLKFELQELRRQMISNTNGGAEDSVTYLTPKRKRTSGSGLPTRQLQNGDDSVIELTPDIDQDIEILAPFFTKAVPVNRSKKTTLRNPGIKSTNDLSKVKSTVMPSSLISKRSQLKNNIETLSEVVSETQQPCSSKDIGSSSNSRNSEQLFSLKRSKLHGTTKSADDILNATRKAGSGSGRLKKVAASQPEANNFEDLSPLDFRANIKSSLPGLADTPISNMAATRINAVHGRGLKRPPKIIKK